MNAPAYEGSQILPSGGVTPLNISGIVLSLRSDSPGSSNRTDPEIRPCLMHQLVKKTRDGSEPPNAPHAESHSGLRSYGTDPLCDRVRVWRIRGFGGVRDCVTGNTSRY